MISNLTTIKKGDLENTSILAFCKEGTYNIQAVLTENDIFSYDKKYFKFTDDGILVLQDVSVIIESDGQPSTYDSGSIIPSATIASAACRLNINLNRNLYKSISFSTYQITQSDKTYMNLTKNDILSFDMISEDFSNRNNFCFFLIRININ